MFQNQLTASERTQNATQDCTWQLVIGSKGSQYCVMKIGRRLFYMLAPNKCHTLKRWLVKRAYYWMLIKYKYNCNFDKHTIH